VPPNHFPADGRTPQPSADREQHGRLRRQRQEFVTEAAMVINFSLAANRRKILAHKQKELILSLAAVNSVSAAAAQLPPLPIDFTYSFLALSGDRQMARMLLTSIILMLSVDIIRLFRQSLCWKILRRTEAQPRPEGRVFDSPRKRGAAMKRNIYSICFFEAWI
jgi:hypothetical protein